MSAWIARLRGLPLDLILFVMLVGGYALALSFRFDRSAALVILLAACAAIAAYGRYSSTRARWLLVCIAVAAIAVAPMILAIYLRHVSAPYTFIHDSALQIEAAIQFLVVGKNPYAENYFGTPLEYWWIPPPGEPVNPALYYFVYYPFVFIGLAPLYLIAQTMFGWFDIRMVFLPLFLVMLGFVRQLASSPERGRALVLAIGLNPLLIPFLVEGRNDVFVFFWIVVTVLALHSRHSAIAAIAFALACASKLTAFFLLPFLAIHIVFANSQVVDFRTVLVSLRRAWIPGLAFAIVFFALMMPFVLWDPNTFVQDTLRYPAGLTEHRYPMQSIGFGGIALAMGWAANDTGRPPFESLQMLFGLPTLIALSIMQFRHNTLPRVLWHGAILLLVVGFFSYMFNDSHLGFGILLAIVGVLMDG